jgi:hypothetical protein
MRTGRGDRVHGVSLSAFNSGFARGVGSAILPIHRR